MKISLAFLLLASVSACGEGFTSAQDLADESDGAQEPPDGSLGNPAVDGASSGEDAGKGPPGLRDGAGPDGSPGPADGSSGRDVVDREASPPEDAGAWDGSSPATSSCWYQRRFDETCPSSSWCQAGCDLDAAVARTWCCSTSSVCYVASSGACP